MGERISRLMDGELDADEFDAAYRELRQGDGVEAWAAYHVIGDALRRTGAPCPGFGGRFAVRLAAEPTVLAPMPRHGARLPLAWAVAASVAAVTVVGWVAVSTFETQPMALVRVREAANVRNAPATPRPLSPDYLLAHQEYSPTAQIQGVGPYLRAVAAGGAEGRP